MKNPLKTLSPCLLLALCMLLFACKRESIRSGVVVDSKTGQPLSDVTVEIYLKNQVKDSLGIRVATDDRGLFSTKEKRPTEQMFILEKGGYISHVGTLDKEGDTVRMEKIENSFKQQ